MTLGCSFNLRHQVGELEDARLTVFPEYLDGAVIFFNHFAFSVIGNPDYSVAHLQSFGFLRLHLMENAPVTYPGEGARLAELPKTAPARPRSFSCASGSGRAATPESRASPEEITRNYGAALSLRAR